MLIIIIIIIIIKLIRYKNSKYSKMGSRIEDLVIHLGIFCLYIYIYIYICILKKQFTLIMIMTIIIIVNILMIMIIVVVSSIRFKKNKSYFKYKNGKDTYLLIDGFIDWLINDTMLVCSYC